MKNNTNVCYNESDIIPDPRNYNLSEDFIFIDQEWGSMFYKYIGKMEKLAAKKICSTYGDSVRLPIPRFADENEFYRTFFAENNLWLDITYTTETGYESASGHSFMEEVKTVSDGKKNFNKYEWMDNISLVNFDNNNIVMTNKGRWSSVSETDIFDSICIYNILPSKKCSKCLDRDFCRFTDRTKKIIECVCPKNNKGQFCKTNSCKSHCQNRGFCQLNDRTEEIDCICRYPFQGKKCETSKKFFIYQV